MIKAEQVSVYRDGKCVLAGIDLTLEPGQVLGVLGPNGAGKSTLLGALCGELKTTQGQLWLDDQPLSHWTGEQRARRLAVLPQTSTLSFAFKVQEVVAMGRLPHDSGQHRDAEIIQAALAAADALHLQDRSYLALSGGERQRVHLARVLAQLWPGEGGQTLLLDEP
ncbi:MAG TPA: ATP-binding cassette domain-containing protein, partial [Pseudomonas sp.]|nr:ATP-binding cassette domain-containing protein [Pseudomonas sp.]